MGWTGNGQFVRLYSWIADKAAGLDISSVRMDQDTNDVTSNGLGNCITRDGQGSASANQPMNTFRHTNVGNGIARSDYASMAQAQDGLTNWTIAGGTADAITATFTPAVTNLSDGQIFFVRAAFANATTTPTFAPNGLTPRAITRTGGSALVVAGTFFNVSDIPGALAELILRYNAANMRYELLNPSNSTLTQGLATTGTVAATVETSAPVGWLMLNDAGMGSAASGATNASDANHDLFVLLFNNISDSYCPLFTSTGSATTRAGQGTAAAAWAANCRMSLPKMLGRALASAGAGGGLTSRALGSTVGEETHLLTLSETPTGITSSGSNTINVTSSQSGIASNANLNTILVNSSGTLWMAGNNVGPMPLGTVTSSGSNSISVTSNNTGGGAHNNMQPSTFLNFKIKQ